MGRYKSKSSKNYSKNYIRRSYNPNYRKRRSTYRRYHKNMPMKHNIGKVVFPRSKVCKLYLNFDTSITSTTGSFTGLSNNLKINSVFNSLGAMSNAQPRYLDTLLGNDSTSAVYRRYVVYGCKVTATCFNADKIGEVGIIGYRNGTVGSMRELIERPDAYAKILEASTATKSIVRLSKYFAMNKLLGVTKRDYIDDDTHMAEYNADPSEVIFANIYYQAIGGQTSSVTVKLKLCFYVKFDLLSDVSDS